MVGCVLAQAVWQLLGCWRPCEPRWWGDTAQITIPRAVVVTCEHLEPTAAPKAAVVVRHGSPNFLCLWSRKVPRIPRPAPGVPFISRACARHTLLLASRRTPRAHETRPYAQHSGAHPPTTCDTQLTHGDSTVGPAKWREATQHA